MAGVLKVYNAATSSWEDVINVAASQFTLVENQTPTGSINGTNTTFTLPTGFVASTLKVYKNGVRMKPGGDDYTATSTGFTMTTAPATGTVLLCDYALGDGTNVVGGNSLVSDEVPTGTVNGTNKVFTTARGYVGATLQVFINGVKQRRGADFTETTPSSGTFTMDEAPLTGDVIFVNYSYNLNPSSNADTVDGINANATPTANTLVPLDANAKFPVTLISNPYMFRATRTSDQTGIADATYTTVQFTSETFDPNNNFDTSTYKYTAPVTGYYQLNLLARITGTSIGIYAAQLVKGTSTVISKTLANEATSSEKRINISDVLYLTAGDAVFAQVYGDVSSGTVTLAGSAVDLSFSGFLVSV